jgi:hypothetical protein
LIDKYKKFGRLRDMKFCKLVFIAVAAIVAAAAAVTAIVYFKDEILELIAGVSKKIDQKKSMLFHSNEYTDYADI